MGGLQKKEELINRYFLVKVTHPKGGVNVLTCSENTNIKEKEEIREILLCGFDYTLFGEK